MPIYSWAYCDWSREMPIPNGNELTFKECQSERKISVNGIILNPQIEFRIVHDNYPEGNMIWANTSPNEELALLWVENAKYERSLWLLDLSENKIVLSLTSLAEGRHFTAKFDGNEKFIVTVSGVGYKKENTYTLKSGKWSE